MIKEDQNSKAGRSETKNQPDKGTNATSNGDHSLYKTLFDKLPVAFSFNKTIYDDKGHPKNYIILEVNEAFEQISGMKKSQLIGKNALEIFPLIKPFWLTRFQDVTQSGVSKDFKDFSLDLETYFHVHVYSPQPNHFAFTLDSATKKTRDHEFKGPKEFYERIMDRLYEGIWVTDKNDFIYYTNRGMTYNTGAPKEQILGKNILTDFNSENIGSFNDFYLKAKSSLTPQQYESKLKTLEGRNAVLAGWLVPLIRNNNFDGMICTIRDISKEIYSHEKIKESEEKLRNIVEHSTNVFYSHTADHVITYLSPQFEKLLGYTIKEANVKWTELTSNNPVNKKGLQFTNKAIKTGQVQKPYELELVHKNGSLVWVEVREAPVVVDGKTTSIVGALIDITQQKKIARQLMENQRDLRNLIDESPIPIEINNKQGDIEYLNYEFTRTFGYTTKDIPNVSTWFEIAYPDKEYRQHVSKLWEKDINVQKKADSPRVPFEVNITCKDGSSKFVQIMWSYVGERQVLIFQNLTQHKLLEEQILQKNDELENTLNELQKTNIELQKATQKAMESDQLKSAFLANMSHEIRTPMNSIIGFSSLLNQSNINAEKRKKYTDFIQKSGTHLLRIIDDIIDIAKIESNQLKIEKSYFSINSFLDNTYDYHRQSSLKEANPEIELILNKELATAPIIIFTDPIRLKQVFDNLLTNSLKNTIKGTVEFGVHELQDNEVTFYVADTGVGIPEKFQKSIFKRFTQVDSKQLKPGTGLGLSIIKGITKLLDGKIWFESTENVGTKFYVKFPIQPND